MFLVASQQRSCHGRHSTHPQQYPQPRPPTGVGGSLTRGRHHHFLPADASRKFAQMTLNNIRSLANAYQDPAARWSFHQRARLGYSALWEHARRGDLKGCRDSHGIWKSSTISAASSPPKCEPRRLYHCPTGSVINQVSLFRFSLKRESISCHLPSNSHIC